MKKEISRKEVEKMIEEFFQREKFSAEEMKKIKKLAMSLRIRLGKYRKEFCKKCFSKLEGKTRVSKQYKTVVCANCGSLNRIKIN